LYADTQTESAPPSRDYTTSRASVSYAEEDFTDVNVVDETSCDCIPRAKCMQLATVISWHYNFKTQHLELTDFPPASHMCGLEPPFERPMRAGGPPHSFRGTSIGNWEMSRPDSEPVPVPGMYISAVRFTFNVKLLSSEVPVFVGFCVQQGGEVHSVFKSGILSNGKVVEHVAVSTTDLAAESTWTNNSITGLKEGDTVVFIYRALENMLDCFANGMLLHQFSGGHSGWLYPMMQVFGSGKTLVELATYQAISHAEYVAASQTEVACSDDVSPLSDRGGGLSTIHQSEDGDDPTPN
jgi:hypothetical protein